MPFEIVGMSLATALITASILIVLAIYFSAAFCREGAMSYTIGFVRKNERDVWATETPTAHQAVAMIATLQESTEEIRFISSPQEGEMGIEMLLLLAKEEAEELPRGR